MAPHFSHRLDRMLTEMAQDAKWVGSSGVAMNIEAVFPRGEQLQSRPTAGDKVEQVRKETKGSLDVGEKSSKDVVASQAKEEILGAIKALTEDGVYSVRFEKHKATEELVVKLVDSEGEVIRQIPAEEIIALSKHLEDLRGNMIKTES